MSPVKAVRKYTWLKKRRQKHEPAINVTWDKISCTLLLRGLVFSTSVLRKCGTQKKKTLKDARGQFLFRFTQVEWSRGKNIRNYEKSQNSQSYSARCG